ncbi:hypothetical protein QQ045_029987 [Rhodiola kirilowii]
MSGYGRRHISERIAWKIDLRKAYDTVCWDFLDSMSSNFLWHARFQESVGGARPKYISGQLPVRYLGIPLTSKAISAQDCKSLIDRITGRIHSWSNRYLSRAGRWLLIQSVLHSVVFFWARMCFLHKKVLHTVSSICARFLWKGNAIGKGGFLVSWKDVCKEKIKGGLGIKDLSIMNEAMRLNQLWELSKDADSIWRAWTRAYWSKGKDWWEADNASKTSWIIKELEDCKQLSSKCISILQNRLVWKGAGDGFMVKDTYDTLVSHLDKVEWHKLVWNRFNSPISTFQLWLVAKNKLLTRDKMRGMRYNGDGSCELCRSAQESRDHLFFECPFTKYLIQNSAGFLKVRWSPIEWHLLIPWFISLNPIAMRSRMMAATISMSAHEVWRPRNSYIFRGEVPSSSIAMKRIINYLRMKIGALDITKVNLVDRHWIDSIDYNLYSF